jgi:hypothetical protein
MSVYCNRLDFFRTRARWLKMARSKFYLWCKEVLWEHVQTCTGVLRALARCAAVHAGALREHPGPVGSEDGSHHTGGRCRCATTAAKIEPLQLWMVRGLGPARARLCKRQDLGIALFCGCLLAPWPLRRRYGKERPKMPSDCVAHSACLQSGRCLPLLCAVTLMYRGGPQ